MTKETVNSIKTLCITNIQQIEDSHIGIKRLCKSIHNKNYKSLERLDAAISSTVNDAANGSVSAMNRRLEQIKRINEEAHDFFNFVKQQIEKIYHDNMENVEALSESIYELIADEQDAEQLTDPFENSKGFSITVKAGDFRYDVLQHDSPYRIEFSELYGWKLWDRIENEIAGSTSHSCIASSRRGPFPFQVIINNQVVADIAY